LYKELPCVIGAAKVLNILLPPNIFEKKFFFFFSGRPFKELFRFKRATKVLIFFYLQTFFRKNLKSFFLCSPRQTSVVLFNGLQIYSVFQRPQVFSSTFLPAFPLLPDNEAE
jgi:hypothetical protein